jgi:hypothetical protein
MELARDLTCAPPMLDTKKTTSVTECRNLSSVNIASSFLNHPGVLRGARFLNTEDTEVHGGRLHNERRKSKIACFSSGVSLLNL